LASDAYACLTSVPFNAAVASRFLSYYNDTLQFHTTPAYLKTPPPSYQQPSIDLFRELEQLQQNIDNGVFQNQYAFEAKLQSLIYATHDGHLELVAGVLAAFTFASPYGIVSVSSDGKELPKVYITNDLIESQRNGSSWQASAISLINGQDAAEYLAQFAALNAIGGLEPHADWNQLMSSPVLDIQNYYSIFEGYSTFYPGEDITTTFENGTVIGPDPWLAIYNNPGETGPLSTGGDFYNFFVLGYYPASYNPEIETESGSAESSSAPSATTLTSDPSLLSTTATPTPTGWDHPAYPQTAYVVQQDLGISGVVTGYFLSDVSIGVLSIPSFQAYDNSVEDFSNTITNFLQRSKEAGIKKILIDLQQNLGGNTLLAIDTFKQVRCKRRRGRISSC
jgi:Peptidase family S41